MISRFAAETRMKVMSPDPTYGKQNLQTGKIFIYYYVAECVIISVASHAIFVYRLGEVFR